MSAVEDIRIKLENRLTVLEHEIESLRDALGALDDERAADQLSAVGAPADAPSPGAPTQRKASPAPTSRRRRTSKRPRASGPDDSAADRGPGQTSSAELERLLAETGGLTAVELARQTGTDYGVVLARIRQLEQAGQGRR